MKKMQKNKKKHILEQEREKWASVSTIVKCERATAPTAPTPSMMW
jgi:hypothetical protein